LLASINSQGICKKPIFSQVSAIQRLHSPAVFVVASTEGSPVAASKAGGNDPSSGNGDDGGDGDGGEKKSRGRKKGGPPPIIGINYKLYNNLFYLKFKVKN
jgi:hypothetical protein